MDPQEHRLISHVAEPSQGVTNHHLGAPLDRFVTIRSMAAQAKARIIDVKSAIKSWRRAVQRVKN